MKDPSVIRRAVLLFLIALCAAATTVSAQVAESGRTRELINGLQSSDPVHRENAAKAASGLKPLPLDLVPHVLNSFRLCEIDPKSLQPVGERSRETRAYLVTALVNAGTPAIAQLELALNDPEAVVRSGAVAALVQIVTASPPSSPSYPILFKALANTHDDVVGYVASAITDLMGVQAVPLLLDSLNDSNPRIRSGSAVTLSYILRRYGYAPRSNEGKVLEATDPWKGWTGPDPNEVILDLAKALNGLGLDTRAKIIDELAGLGPGAKAAIPYVVPMLKDPDRTTRLRAINFVGATGRDATVAVPDLIQSLQDPDPAIRRKAIDFLGVIGPPARDAVPDLDVVVQSADSNISKHAALALANIDPGDKRVLPIVMAMLNQPDYGGERRDAIEALGEMGGRARVAVPVLENLVDSDDVFERRAAVIALARIEEEDALPTLVRAMNSKRDDDQMVPMAAVTAVEQLGSSSSRAISVLVSAFSNESDPLREAASNALVRIGSAAVPALIAALKNGDLYQRAWSVQTLSRIKPLPNDATDALKLALNDKSEIVRTEAADALKGSKFSAGGAITEQHMVADIHRDNDTVQDKNLDALAAGKAVTDSRIYGKAEILASIPPDENHEYPSELKFSVPIVPSGGSAEAAEFLVTVHAAKDGDDQLAVWKRTGENKYQRLAVQQTALDSHFEEPEVFSSTVLVRGRGREHYERALFVNLPLHRYSGDWDGIDDNVFAVDHDQLRPVEIQDAVEYSKKLRDGEGTWNSLGNKFSDNDLEFGFNIWEEHECHACASGGEIDGTYKVVKEMRYDARKKDWVASWKMLVDTAKRTE